MSASAGEAQRVQAADVIEIVNPLEESGWNQWVEQFSEGSIFQTTEWCRVISDTYGHSVLGIILRQAGEIVALVPVIEVNSRILGRRASSVAFADFADPLAKDGECFRGILAATIQLGAERRWKSVEFRGGRNLLPHAPAADVFLQHDLNLSLGTDSVFAKLESSTRRNVLKAERSGMRFEVCQSISAMKRYYELHCRTRQRLGAPPQSMRFFTHIWEKFIDRNQGFIGLAWHGKNAIAGLVVLQRGDQALYKFGAADERYQSLRPSNFVMWQAIKQAVLLRCKRYHFGRTACGDHGLRRYKLGWGCEEKLLEYFRVDLKSGGFTSASDSTGTGWSEQIFRRLPIPVVRRLGETLYPHLI